MVTVANAQRFSEGPSLPKISTVATPIEPDIFNVFALALAD
jgi:hypothetical protein